jgi:hypothetical protein
VEKAHGTHGCGLRGRGTGFSEGNRQGYRKGRPPGPYRKRGFHLAAASQEQIQEILGGFRSLGVEQVGATHCSGDLAISMFQGAYGEDFRPLGAGRVLTFPLKSSVQAPRPLIPEPALPSAHELTADISPLTPSRTRPGG